VALRGKGYTVSGFLSGGDDPEVLHKIDLQLRISNWSEIVCNEVGVQMEIIRNEVGVSCPQGFARH